MTSTVENLAASGDLKVLQLLNRNLEIAVLHWSQSWANSFRPLEILALQGRKGETNIVSMPFDLFKDMNSLASIRLGVHQHLAELPSFEGLQNLESMSLAVLSSVTLLPSLQPLGDLGRLELVAMTSLRALPDVTSNTQLVHMVVTRAPVCCNGFLGVCSASSLMCSSMSDGRCIQEVDGPSAESQAQAEACNGVMCQFEHNGTTSSEICYNDYLQVIAFSISPALQDARKQEILQGVGTPCNAVEEAWLGCG
ncbi:hypothetical protein PHYPSEUDO_009121 [Phytophthora pseudosyringae]|uniref:WLGC domain-containing protein n=1 Tax=Phytophthora pseudosyringae TaxID=221518 RepID=A0A8T1VD98_9STRA|nr:hypothetical protein PHYPSEUDO_009121 [Phytophthora pseudosyringae]